MEDKFSKVIDLLDGLMKIEKSIADLYKAFAAAFPMDEAFWNNLSVDEKNHAHLITELKTSLLQNGTSLEIRKLNSYALDTYRKGLEEQIGRLHRGEIGRRNAFFLARDFEKTLIEGRFYELIQTRDESSLAILDRIQKETEFHWQKLERHIQIYLR